MKRFTTLLMLVLVVAAISCDVDGYSSGTRAGQIYKLSRKGMFCKTWEGEMNLGGMRRVTGKDGASFVSNTWQFTVPDSDTSALTVINRAIETGDRVKIAYNQVLNAWPCRSESDYLVVTVAVDTALAR